MMALVKRINANGVLIDGVGTQMHLGVGHIAPPNLLVADK
jgi:GH35 family endo-1,4-beta-xylanase